MSWDSECRSGHATNVGATILALALQVGHVIVVVTAHLRRLSAVWVPVFNSEKQPAGDVQTAVTPTPNPVASRAEGRPAGGWLSALRQGWSVVSLNLVHTLPRRMLTTCAQVWSTWGFWGRGQHEVRGVVAGQPRTSEPEGQVRLQAEAALSRAACCSLACARRPLPRWAEAGGPQTPPQTGALEPG